MNSPFVVERAEAFAKRLQTLGGNDAARLRSAYELAAARSPLPEEAARALTYLNQEELLLKTSGEEAPRHKAWARLCQALLASNEFLYTR